LLVEIADGRLTRARSCHGPALARQPSCLVNTLECAASQRLQIATQFFERHSRQPPCRVGFGTWALAVQLRLKLLGGHAQSIVATHPAVDARGEKAFQSPLIHWAVLNDAPWRNCMFARFVGCSVVAILLFQTSAAAQTIEVPSGFPVPMSLVNEKIKAPPAANLTPEQFRLRLNEGGRLSISGGDLVLGSPNFAKNETIFLALDELELKRGARIITGGNTLVIFANRITSEDAVITAFKDDTHSATNGGVASPGNPGDSAGLVSIHVIDRLDGILHVDLSGQNGGDGGSGIAGLPGTNGVKGDQAVSGTFNCDKGGGNGTDGSAGGVGGRGGDGGSGGQGGIFELFNIGPRPIPSASFTFHGAAGDGGKGGPGGPGGAGGKAGDGGDGKGFCKGGKPGNNGVAGAAGTSGTSGARAGDGQAIAKNIDLKFVLETELKRSFQ
jgi:hypothetical protein